jgi:hypothetical protein
LNKPNDKPNYKPNYTNVDYILDHFNQYLRRLKNTSIDHAYVTLNTQNLFLISQIYKLDCFFIKEGTSNIFLRRKEKEIEKEIGIFNFIDASPTPSSIPYSIPRISNDKDLHMHQYQNYAKLFKVYCDREDNTEFKKSIIEYTTGSYLPINLNTISHIMKNSDSVLKGHRDLTEADLLEIKTFNCDVLSNQANV